MCDKILGEIFAKNGLENTDSQINYLQSLKPAAKRLWQAYRSQAIAIDYSEPKIQEAYLLRYFVPYSCLLSAVLKKLDSQGNAISSKGGLLSACFFGCGPGPELAGLIRHLKQKSDRPAMLIARMFDVASVSWEHGRKIIENSIFENEWDAALIESEAVTADISAEALLANSKNVRSSVEEADLIVFQNCLNELNTERKLVTATNLRAVISAAKSNATIVLIERDGYTEAKNMLLNLFQWANQATGLTTVGELTSTTKLGCRGILDQIPSVVTEHLFVRRRGHSPIQPNEKGLLLAADIKFIWLVISKR